MDASSHAVTPSCTIREASRRDADAIGDLWVELMSFHAALDPHFGIPPNGRVSYIRHIQSAFHDDNYRVLVAERDERVAGFVMGYIAQNPPIFTTPRFGFIADLCVAHTHRRLGIGEALVRMLTAWFRGRGLTSIQLNVSHHNPISQAFWRKLGCTDYLDHMWWDLSG